MVNILIIHQSSELYGSDKTLLLLLQNIDRTRFKPVVILPSRGPLYDALVQDEMDVVVAPVLKIYRKMFTPGNISLFLRQIKVAFRLLDDLHQKHHFDLIYSNTLAVLLGMVYARKRHIKHLWHVHEIITHPKAVAAIFPKLLYRYADVVVCNSVATKDNLIARIPRLEEKITVIHNGVDVGPPSRMHATKEDFGFAPQDIVITLVGRINRLKGHKLLLGVYKEHFLEDNRIKLLFTGSPVPGQEYYLHELQQIIAQNKLDANVKILPFTNSLSRVWDITDIAVCPSTEAESFGLVALEAMLAKKPVVASNLGGYREIVTDGKTGFLFENKNEIQLKAALQKLITDENLRIAFGNRGFERALSEFSLRRYIQKFEAILA